MTALVTAVLAVAARIIARIAFAAGSREKPAPAATAAPAHPAFSCAAVAGSRPAVTRTSVARIAVRPGSRARPGPSPAGSRAPRVIVLGDHAELPVVTAQPLKEGGQIINVV